MNIKSSRQLQNLKTAHTDRRAVATALEELSLRPAKDEIPDSSLNREERRMRKKLRRKRR